MNVRGARSLPAPARAGLCWRTQVAPVVFTNNRTQAPITHKPRPLTRPGQIGQSSAPLPSRALLSPAPRMTATALLEVWLFCGLPSSGNEGCRDCLEPSGLPAHRLARAGRLPIALGHSAVQVERIAGQKAEQVEGQSHRQRRPVGPQIPEQPVVD